MCEDHYFLNQPLEPTTGSGRLRLYFSFDKRQITNIITEGWPYLKSKHKLLHSTVPCYFYT